MSLIADATKKSGLIWITRPGATQAIPTWHHWHDNAAYVITDLSDVDRVSVIVRSKTTGARAGEWPAVVTRVTTGSAEWDKVVPEIHAARLNSPPLDESSPLFRLDPPTQKTKPASGGTPDLESTTGV
ncbi:hypothetical protein [Kibdelosporangium phytohabitans]|uniref:Uncharacterized protein n=1 Tax=Kibdelosporangium phytohabitans TaxID=860235 RepID=A0A0N9I0W8_9PSEU|nr:hypothetical protein [Kibdelosporangium phytohabitans]ALG11221.1 hypothetical protein AOZ06_33950 [Kibdelosporangium phytohabitans]MBE1462491.1 hypothetical protein [Kibdelosporangium phytohabitans]